MGDLRLIFQQVGFPPVRTNARLSARDRKGRRRSQWPSIILLGPLRLFISARRQRPRLAGSAAWERGSTVSPTNRL